MHSIKPIKIHCGMSMAKETAHQIATPLSALMGWLQILEHSPFERYMLFEMNKDLARLDIVSQRFSGIGSKPKLQNRDIIAYTEEQLSYMEKRIPAQVKLIREGDWSESKYLQLSPPLYAWALENIIRNAVDSVQGKGSITISHAENNKHFTLFIKDTGKGIPKRFWKKIFLPGFTTKSTGWGMGLSLCKRIIEKYHKGKLYIVSSTVGIGTIFAIDIFK